MPQWGTRDLVLTLTRAGSATGNNREDQTQVGTGKLSPGTKVVVKLILGLVAFVVVGWALGMAFLPQEAYMD